MNRGRWKVIVVRDACVGMEHIAYGVVQSYDVDIRGNVLLRFPLGTAAYRPDESFVVRDTGTLLTS